MTDEWTWTFTPRARGAALSAEIHADSETEFETWWALQKVTDRKQADLIADIR